MREFVNTIDLLPIVPELILLLTATVLLLLDLFASRKNLSLTLALTSIAGIALAGGAEYFLYGLNLSGFYGSIVADSFSILFEVIYLVVALLTILMSLHYLKENEMTHGEYYVLLITSVVGMMLMTSSLELLVIFIGLELMSISSYILVGMKEKQYQSKEASLKYLLLGAFSTGFLLYGISLIYGATGSTYLPKIIEVLKETGVSGNPLAMMGVVLITIAMSFKIAIVPFHMWTPDVYTGAPTPVTAFLSAAAKASGFAVFIRVLTTGINVDSVEWTNILWILAVLSMTVGNVMALKQDNVKRMLAYSSIVHAGYVMVALVVGNSMAVSSIIFYSCAYALMGMGAFGVLTIRRGSSVLNTFDDLSGYAKESPFLAFLMALFMFSLIGFPLTAGFTGKLQIFAAALDSGWVWLTVIALLNSALSVYYYLRVIVYMYMREPLSDPAPSNAVNYGFALTGLVGAASAVLYLGIFPDSLMQLTTLSVSRMF